MEQGSVGVLQFEESYVSRFVKIWFPIRYLQPIRLHAPTGRLALTHSERRMSPQTILGR
jgi:hypothetical protein